MLTLVVFTLLIKLGFWQMGRGEQKLDYEKTLEERSLVAHESLDLLLRKGMTTNAKQNLTGTKIKAEVVPISGRLLLLDNQVWKGQVGYLIFQPVQVTSGFEAKGKYFLVELGFIKSNKDRRILPAIEELTQSLNIEGRVYQRQSNPISDKLYAELGWPKRIQNLNIEALEVELGLHLLPFVVQPSNLNLAYPQPWKPVPMSSQKHFGYALQWFSMALVFAVIMVVVFMRVLNINLIPNGEKNDSSKNG